MKSTWMPDPALQSDLADEIKQEFKRHRKRYFLDPSNPALGVTKLEITPMPPEDFINDCAAIAAFLFDRTAVERQLSRLNTRLEEKAAELKASNQPIKVNLLRTFLEEELAAAGFYPKFAVSTAFIEPQDFRSAIAKGLMIKDTILGAQYHAEFSHAMQWLLIVWQNAESHFLSRPVIDVFKAIGDETSVFYRGYGTSESEEGDAIRDMTEEQQNVEPDEDLEFSEANMWDLIVDRTGEYDYRSPEQFISFIENENNNVKLLRELIGQRRQKRLTEAPEATVQRKYPETFIENEKYRKAKPGLLEPVASDQNSEPKAKKQKL